MKYSCAKSILIFYAKIERKTVQLSSRRYAGAKADGFSIKECLVLFVGNVFVKRFGV